MGLLPYSFCQLNTPQLVISLACTGFTEGSDETPGNSNINLIKNSINKGCWSGGVLEINQNPLQFSPVVLMIHWSFCRKWRVISRSFYRSCLRKNVAVLALSAKRWKKVFYLRREIPQRKNSMFIAPIGWPHTQKKAGILITDLSQKLITHLISPVNSQKHNHTRNQQKERGQ